MLAWILQRWKTWSDQTVENRVDLFKSGPTAEWFKMVYAKA